MNPAIIPSEALEADVLAICVSCGEPYSIPPSRCKCGGDIRLLCDPMSSERYARVRYAKKAWEQLRTRRVTG